jgi:uroporphyrinogen-III synthase
MHPDAIVVTSGSTARGVLAIGEALGAEADVRALPVIAIGAGTAVEATRLGFSVVATAASHDVAAIADAVATAVGIQREQP